MCVGSEDVQISKSKDIKQDVILLTGDAQSVDINGHFIIARKIIQFASDFGVKTIITLGGFSSGTLLKKEPRVFGAATSKKIIKEFEKYNVVFKKNPVNQIIGAAGILLSIAKRHNIEGVCLMGETSGLLGSDPKTTECVVSVLSKYLGFKINLDKLDKRAKEMDKIIANLQNAEYSITNILKKGDFPSEKIRPYYESFREPILGWLNEMGEKVVWQEWEVTPEIHNVENKIHFITPLTIGEEKATLCFSFEIENAQWYFQHLEAITIRLDKLTSLPVSKFPDLTEQKKAKMREEKLRRQFIFSTHNANIPVLGDAELTIGLRAIGEATEGYGEIPHDWMGSIDNSQVCVNVERILEGGKEAFETRRAKYGF